MAKLKKYSLLYAEYDGINLINCFNLYLLCNGLTYSKNILHLRAKKITMLMFQEDVPLVLFQQYNLKH